MYFLVNLVNLVILAILVFWFLKSVIIIDLILKMKRPVVEHKSTFSNFAATLLLVSLRTKSIIHSHQFPPSVVPRSGSFLNDIAINLAGGELGKFAYISDSDRGVLVVFSLALDR